MRPAVQRGGVEEKEIMYSGPECQKKATHRCHNHPLDPATFAALRTIDPEAAMYKKQKNSRSDELVI
jgi:hypothetical protein